MNQTIAAHEGFMNDSRMILPRVGVGGRGGEGVGISRLSIHASPRQKLRGRILATQTRPMDATTGIRGGL